jgi:pimeloyl-ACP methyl ester carboxylesterase
MALANAQPGRFMGRLREIQPPAIDRLAEISTPTLVISGALDMSDIHEITNLLKQQVPGIQAVESPDVAHMVNMERPEEFNRVVVEFLTSL